MASTQQGAKCTWATKIVIFDIKKFPILEAVQDMDMP